MQRRQSAQQEGEMMQARIVRLFGPCGAPPAAGPAKQAGQGHAGQGAAAQPDRSLPVHPGRLHSEQSPSGLRKKPWGRGAQQRECGLEQFAASSLATQCTAEGRRRDAPAWRCCPRAHRWALTDGQRAALVDGEGGGGAVACGVGKEKGIRAMLVATHLAAVRFARHVSCLPG